MLDEVSMRVGSLNRSWHLVSLQQMSVVVYYLLVIGRTGVKSQLGHSLPVRPWASH